MFCLLNGFAAEQQSRPIFSSMWTYVQRCPMYQCCLKQSSKVGLFSQACRHMFRGAQCCLGSKVGLFSQACRHMFRGAQCCLKQGSKVGLSSQACRHMFRCAQCCLTQSSKEYVQKKKEIKCFLCTCVRPAWEWRLPVTYMH